MTVVVGLIIAVFQSSWLAVATITVEGADRSDVEQILADAEVVEGTPIVSIRAGSVEEKLRLDPWVAEAQVRVVWPTSVEVAVVEHIAIARVKSGSSWVVSSRQGVVLARGQRLVEPLVDIEIGSLEPGEAISDPLVIGALEFIASLPVELKDGLTIRATGTDLVAVVGGYDVMVGATTDMAQKAVTLAVLLEEQEITPGASINLVSPFRPAVTDPQPEVEGSQEVTTETTGSG